MMLHRQLQPTNTPQTQWGQRLSTWGLVAEAAIATTVVSIFVSTTPGLFNAPTVAATASAQPEPPSNQLIAIHLPIGTAASAQTDARKNFKRGIKTLEKEVNTVVTKLSNSLHQK